MKKLKNEALQQAKTYRQEKIVLTESLDKAKSVSHSEEEEVFLLTSLLSF